VSKPCCPACWELLDILRDETDQFAVAGRHTTIYPVELPHWLPDTVLEKMLVRFNMILLDQLYILDREHKRKRAQTLSELSDAGGSTASHDRDYPQELGMATYGK
jgi:hypothetical protein